MQEIFKGYYKPSEARYGEIWKNAVFIFDTNILLNLYRYKKNTRDDVLKVMTKLKKQIWLPYHVALEFQTRRLGVINDQNSSHKEAINVIEKDIKAVIKSLQEITTKRKSNHNCVDTSSAIEELEKLKKTYSSDYKKQQDNNRISHTQDPVRERIDTLFKHKIGQKPTQTEIDEMEDEGRIRYDNDIPPGYQDSDKTDTVFYGGVTYNKKFSDLFIWKEIIKYSSNENIKNVVLITDDRKSDWWYEVGNQTIGARPELTQEIIEEADIENFLMYSTESFLKHAQKHLKVNVTKNSLDEAREISESRERYIRRRSAISDHRRWQYDAVKTREQEHYVQQCIAEWLSRQYESIRSNHGFPDLIAQLDNSIIGYEIKSLSYLEDIRGYLHQFSMHAGSTIAHNDFDLIKLILVVPEDQYAIKDALTSIDKVAGIMGHTLPVLLVSCRGVKDAPPHQRIVVHKDLLI